MTKPKTWKNKATFLMSKNLEELHTHSDAIIIIVTVHNHMVRRVLFSNGNSSNVPYNDVMKKSRIS